MKKDNPAFTIVKQNDEALVALYKQQRMSYVRATCNAEPSRT